MHKTLTSVVALAGLAAAAGAAEAADAVIAGDTDEPMLLTSTQMDAVTAGGKGAISAYAAGSGHVYVYGAVWVYPYAATATISANVFPTDSIFVALSAFASSDP